MKPKGGLDTYRGVVLIGDTHSNVAQLEKKRVAQTVGVASPGLELEGYFKHGRQCIPLLLRKWREKVTLDTLEHRLLVRCSSPDYLKPVLSCVLKCEPRSAVRAKCCRCVPPLRYSCIVRRVNVLVVVVGLFAASAAAQQPRSPPEELTVMQALRVAGNTANRWGLSQRRGLGRSGYEITDSGPPPDSNPGIVPKEGK